MSYNEIKAALQNMNTAQLRQVWASAMKVMGVTTAYYMNHGRSCDDVRGCLKAGNVAGAVFEAVLDARGQIRDEAPVIKTGRRVLARATTSGASDYYYDEAFPDETLIDAKTAAVLAV